MTRVAMIASSYLPHLGGVEEHVLHVADALVRRGHDVVVWTVEQNGTAPVTGGPAPVRHLPCPMPNMSPGGAARWAAAYPDARRAWQRAFEADRPEVLDIQCYGPNGPYATALARRTGTPLVYSNHGETFMDAHGSFDTSLLLRRTLARTLKAADAVTSCSAFAAADLGRFGPTTAPVTIVGNGIDLEQTPAPVDEPLPARYVAGVGRLVANKGFDTLLDAYAALGRDDLDVVIVGDGPYRAELASRATALGIADRVRFLGARSRGEVRTVLDGATAHVVPSHVEAFGIVILEGWRSGVPVVCTRVGGPPEFVTDDEDGLLFDPRSPDDLAQCLRRLLDDDGLRARIGEAGRRRAASFTWDAVADRYEETFAVAGDAAPDRARRRRA